MPTTTTEKFDIESAMGYPEADLIPARRVLICWKDGPQGTEDILVTPFPDDRNYFSDYWDFTSGACYSDWLAPGAHTMTPENVFGELAAFYGFANRIVAEKAVVMFARIRECDWARKMLASDSYARIRKAGLSAHW